MTTLNLFRGFPAIVLTAALLPACQQQSADGTANDPASAAQAAPRNQNDFPTQARVEYVLQCMLEHGGQNYDNLYHCVCAADTLASKMSYEEFGQAQTFTYLFNMPGERGGEFRDPPESKRLRTLFKDTKALAESTCFPKKPEAPVKKK